MFYLENDIFVYLSLLIAFFSMVFYAIDKFSMAFNVSSLQLWEFMQHWEFMQQHELQLTFPILKLSIYSQFPPILLEVYSPPPLISIIVSLDRYPTPVNSNLTITLSCPAEDCKFTHLSCQSY